MQARRRVLIVDDEALLLALAQERFRDDPRFEVVGVASESEALAMAPELEPDVVVVDLLLPRLTGYDTARRLSELRPSAAILVTSGDATLFVPERAAATGVRGFIAKRDLTPTGLSEALAGA
jgi:NarL family two-component system response regulator LiaR